MLLPLANLLFETLICFSCCSTIVIKLRYVTSWKHVVADLFKEIIYFAHIPLFVPSQLNVIELAPPGACKTLVDDIFASVTK
jgi:hypothetical protein